MLTETVIVGLAAWRLTSLISREEGPFKVLQRFRSLLGIGHDSEGNVISWPDWAKVLICPLCLSVWFAVAMYGVWYVEPVVVLVIAGMGVAALVEHWFTR